MANHHGETKGRSGFPLHLVGLALLVVAMLEVTVLAVQITSSPMSAVSTSTGTSLPPTVVFPPATPLPRPLVAMAPSPTPTSLPSPPPPPSPTPVPSLDPPASPAPRATPEAGEAKWVEVDLSEQRLVAYENGQPVFETLVSTGIARYPTVTGRYRIYLKLLYDNMSGPGYYLPNVPYVMYFYRGYALHGTYWHNNFGRPMSHGCVNLRTEDAKWLFQWTEPRLPPGARYVYAGRDNPGTLVIIHP